MVVGLRTVPRDSKMLPQKCVVYFQQVSPSFHFIYPFTLLSQVYCCYPLVSRFHRIIALFTRFIRPKNALQWMPGKAKSWDAWEGRDNIQSHTVCPGNSNSNLFYSHHQESFGFVNIVGNCFCCLSTLCLVRAAVLFRSLCVSKHSSCLTSVRRQAVIVVTSLLVNRTWPGDGDHLDPWQWRQQAVVVPTCLLADSSS